MITTKHSGALINVPPKKSLVVQVRKENAAANMAQVGKERAVVVTLKASVGKKGISISPRKRVPLYFDQMEAISVYIIVYVFCIYIDMFSIYNKIICIYTIQ